MAEVFVVVVALVGVVVPVVVPVVVGVVVMDEEGYTGGVMGFFDGATDF